MIDICFNISQCGLLKFALDKYDIAYSYQSLDMGKIAANDFENARKEWIDVFFAICSKQERAKIAKEEKQNFNNILKRVMSGEDVRIWLDTCPNTMCGFYHLMYHIQGMASKVFVMEMPNNIGTRAPEYDKSWDEVDPEDIRNHLSFQRELSRKEQEEAANKWEKLAAENADLRVRINGEIQSVSIDYLDDEIFSFAPEGRFNFANMVGYALCSKHSYNTFFVETRIWTMVENGRLIILEGVKNPKNNNNKVFLIKNTDYKK